MPTRPSALLLALSLMPATATGQGPTGRDLTALSLNELAELEVTSVSKKPERLWNTPAASPRDRVEYDPRRSRGRAILDPRNNRYYFRSVVGDLGGRSNWPPRSGLSER